MFLQSTHAKDFGLASFMELDYFQENDFSFFFSRKLAMKNWLSSINATPN